MGLLVCRFSIQCVGDNRCQGAGDIRFECDAIVVLHVVIPLLSVLLGVVYSVDLHNARYTSWSWLVGNSVYGFSMMFTNRSMEDEWNMVDLIGA
ncbi:hypothetical protein Tco_0005373 [Tanacetum coccineum]